MPLSPHARTRLAWSVVVLALLAWLAWAWLPRARALPMARIDSGPLTVTVFDQGRTRARELYAIAAPVTGTLERIELEAGDPIEAGQVLARLRRPAARRWIRAPAPWPKPRWPPPPPAKPRPVSPWMPPPTSCDAPAPCSNDNWWPSAN